MIHINFLAASRIQAAIECLPATCSEDHNDPYLAGQGEIEMSQHDIDVAYKFAQELQDDEAADPAHVIAHLAAYFSIPNFLHKDMDGKRLGEVMQNDIAGAGK